MPQTYHTQQPAVLTLTTEALHGVNRVEQSKRLKSTLVSGRDAARAQAVWKGTSALVQHMLAVQTMLTSS